MVVRDIRQRFRIGFSNQLVTRPKVRNVPKSPPFFDRINRIKQDLSPAEILLYPYSGYLFEGVRITFDPVAGPFLEHLANTASPGGVLIIYSHQSGQPTPLPLISVVGKGLTVRGFTMSEVARNKQTAANAKQYIVDRLAAGRFVPIVAKTFPLEQIQDAYHYLEGNNQIGRVIITMPS